MLGDQIYVDEGSPRTRERIRAARDVSEPPGEEVANFEEYTWLYHESWGDPAIRWLLSTISTAMVLDDHDMADDWNISRSWKAEMNRKPWWRERLSGGLMSYWIYQHIGNIAPAELEHHEEYAAVRRATDGGPVLREFVERVDEDAEGKVWSFKRDLGATRLVVVDDRTGRHFEEGRRSIFDDHEWDWIQDACRGDFDHLLFATTDPVLLAPGLHYLEAWNEALCDGAWGERAVIPAEKLRRAADFDHWAAFHVSFERLERLVRDVGSGARGRPPASIVLLSGDVHHAYLAEVAYRRDDGRAQRRLPGGLLAVPQRARRPRATRDPRRADAARRGDRARPGASGRGARPGHPLALRGGALLRQPGRDGHDGGQARRRQAREDRRRSELGRTHPRDRLRADARLRGAGPGATPAVPPQRALPPRCGN